MTTNAVNEKQLREMWEGQSNVMVSVRVRPILKHDLIKRSCIRVVDEKLIFLMDPMMDKQQNDILRANRTKEKQYAFDFAFDSDVRQIEVYERTTKFLIHGVIEGFNCTVFAYGQVRI